MRLPKGIALQLMTECCRAEPLAPSCNRLLSTLDSMLSCSAAMHRNLRLRQQQLLEEKRRAADPLMGFIGAVHEAQQRAIAVVSGACICTAVFIDPMRMIIRIILARLGVSCIGN